MIDDFTYTLNEFHLLASRAALWTNTQGCGSTGADHFFSRKNATDVVILGSGPSIATLGVRHWDFINRVDSVGFNYWFLHPFAPTHYIFQGSRRDNSNHMLTAWESASLEGYDQTAFAIRGSAFAEGELDLSDERLGQLRAPTTFLITEFPFSNYCRHPPHLLFNVCRHLGILIYGRRTAILPKFKSTLGLILSLCFCMGYHRIFIAGCDMRSNLHFWDTPKYNHLAPSFGPQPQSRITELNDTKTFGTPLVEYVAAFAEWAFVTAGVEIYTMTDDTLLFPNIKLMPDGINQ